MSVLFHDEMRKSAERPRGRKARAATRRLRPRYEPLESRVVLSTYYVSTTGNDSAAGTASAPFATIQKGSQCRPGRRHRGC